MPSYTYIRKKQEKLSERNSKRGKRSGEARRKRMQDEASALKVTGTIKTTGVLGEHFIELMADDHDSINCWVRVDGELRQPRTMRGFFSVLNYWAWRCAGKRD